jgi:hypothetical protein
VASDRIGQARERSSDSPEDVAVVLVRRLPSSHDYPWVGLFVIAFADRAALLTGRLPRMVLELGGTPSEAWDEIEEAHPEDWERLVQHAMRSLGVDVDVPLDADDTFAREGQRLRSAKRFDEFSRYQRNGLALDLWRLPSRGEAASALFA